MPASLTSLSQVPIWQGHLIVGYKDPITGKTLTDRNYVNKSATKPIFDSVTGLWRGPDNLPWTGDVLNPDGTVSKAQNGKILPQDIYGNPLPVQSVVTTVKQPDIAAATSDLVNQQKNIQGAIGKSFSNYLSEAKRINDEAKVQLARDQSAFDTAGTEARLNAAYQRQAGELHEINRTYAANQGEVQGQITAANKNYDQDMRDRIAKLQSDLDSENAQYESAAQAVAQQAYDRAKRQISVYQLGSGTPTSGSGDLTNRYMRAYANINIPLQQDLSARRYAQTQLISGQLQQAQAQAYQDLMNELSGRSALNADLANRTYGTAQYLGGLDAQTANQIQQLRTATAGMSRQQAQQYLASLAVPFDIAQRVIGAETSTLAGLSGLESAANYYTLSTPYDTSRVPPVSAYTPSFTPRTYTPMVGGNITSVRSPVAPGTAPVNSAAVANSVSQAIQNRVASQIPRTPAWSNNGDGTYTRNSDGSVGWFDSNGQFQVIGDWAGAYPLS